MRVLASTYIPHCAGEVIDVRPMAHLTSNYSADLPQSSVCLVHSFRAIVTVYFDARACASGNRLSSWCRARLHSTFSCYERKKVVIVNSKADLVTQIPVRRNPPSTVSTPMRSSFRYHYSSQTGASLSSQANAIHAITNPPVCSLRISHSHQSNVPVFRAFQRSIPA